MKNSYILLRNNVESAPLSAEDLQRLGLKATDLLWVECQSVCWQNPHEIPELRSLISTTNNITQDINSPAMAEHTVQLPVIQEATAKSAVTEKKIINPEPDITLTQMQQYGGLGSEEDFPDVYKKKTTLNTKYSRSLDEIKEMYIQTMEGKGKNLLELKLPPQTKKIILYAGLVVAGALLMLVIKSFSSDKQVVVKKAPAQEPIAASTTPMPVAELETDSAAIPESYETIALPAEVSVAANNQPPPVTIKKTTAPATPVKMQEEKTEAAEKNPGTAAKSTRADIETKALTPVASDDIEPLLTLTANEYNVGSFGGIRNLKMTLQNDSKFMLEKVTVEIQYLNPEGIILKTDNIIFKSLSPGDKATIAVDKTKRGVKVGYRIVKIDT